MTNLPITYKLNETEFSDIINTNDIVNIKEITISNDYKIYYINDLAIFNIIFKKDTNLSLSTLKSLSKKKLETLEDYKFAIQCYLTTLSLMIVKKVPIDWNEFKNYLTCKIGFENSEIEVNVNVKDEYKPNEEYNFAKEKFMVVNNKEPIYNWNDIASELTSLDLSFTGCV